jgi:4-amino-4-deoxy-L-arabinose transferase-like glycosyltransferase
VLQAPVYHAAPGGLLDELLPMRLLSVLLGAIAVLAITLFVSELLPRSPWTWAGGGLAVALQPMFGFIVGGVNSDALMFACSAVTLLLIARMLRHGPTARRAVALGAVVAAGVLTKPLFLAFVPVAALALVIAVVRAGPLRSRLPTLAAAAAVFLVPVVLYQVIGGAAFDHPYFAPGSSGTGLGGAAVAGGRNWGEELSFIGQLFLPRAPFLHDQIAGIPLRHLWLNGFLGRFGWLDYSLPVWVYDWGWRLALAVVVCAVVALVVHRRALRGRWAELLVYVAAAASVCVVIGHQDYNARHSGGAAFEQARYLFPLLGLYAGLIAVAVRLAGRRFGQFAAVAVVTLAAVHTVTALMTTVERYYS